MVINTPYGNSGSAHRRLRDPVRRGVDEHPVHHHRAGRVGGRAGHRGRHPRRHRRAVAAGTACRTSAPTEPCRFGARLAAAVAARGPLCVGIDPHPELLRAWGLPATADGLARFCDICVQAYAGFADRQTAGRVLRGLRLGGFRGARAHHRRADAGRGAGAGRRQARRHRLHDGGLRRGLGRRRAAGRRRGDRLALSGFRFAAAAAGRGRRQRARRVRPGRDVQPGGREHPARTDRRPHRRAVDRRRRGARSTGPALRLPVRSGWSSAPRWSRCPTSAS